MREKGEMQQKRKMDIRHEEMQMEESWDLYMGIDRR